MNILVTGGCGFIGSNFINYLLREESTGGDISIANLDLQTYAGKGRNLDHLGLNTHPRYTLVSGDIADSSLVRKVFEDFKPEFVFNFAAESHVDRSISNSSSFVRSNYDGVAVLLENAKQKGIKRFVQISTDEVYGSIDKGAFSEESPINPSSPYSATKAGAELLALSYSKTHSLPLVITRSANNYGPFQFPEKILPLFITNLIDGKKVPLMWSEENPGLNVRDWLHVNDNCRAIWYVAMNGKDGEVYNVPGENEKTNSEITQIILNEFEFGQEMIERVPHRKAHDFRYSISGDKIHSLGFRHQSLDLEDEIKKLVKWYNDNQSWWRPLKNA